MSGTTLAIPRNYGPLQDFQSANPHLQLIGDIIQLARQNAAPKRARSNDESLRGTKKARTVASAVRKSLGKVQRFPRKWKSSRRYRSRYYRKRW